MTAEQVAAALALVEAGEKDIERVAELVGCQWYDFFLCDDETLLAMADGLSWWLDYTGD